MSQVEFALCEHLVADPAIAALLDDRLYPVEAPEGVAPPYAVYHRISTHRLRSFGGPTGNARPRIQVDCYAKDYVTAKALANAVRRRLDGYRGTWPSPDGEVEVAALRCEDERDLNEPGARLKRVKLDFIISHQET